MFRLANRSDVSTVYQLWKEHTGHRIYNIVKSIDNRALYLFEDGNGFIRIYEGGKTVDYLKMDLVFRDRLLSHSMDIFFLKVDELILQYGFIYGVALTSYSNLKIFQKYNWSREGDKFTFGKDGKSYVNYLCTRDLSDVGFKFNLVRRMFGERL